MSVISDLRQDVTEGVANAKGWLDRLDARLPEVLDEAEKLNGDPLVKGIVESGLHVPEAWVEFALDFLGKLATVASAAGAGSVPATPAGTSTPIGDSVQADLAQPDAQPASS